MMIEKQLSKHIGRKMSPFHRWAGITLVVSAIFTGLLLLTGSKIEVEVEAFNLSDGIVSPATQQLTLEFSRPMNRESVETGWNLEPALVGDFSWRGKRVSFRFNERLQPGQEYRLVLNQVEDQFGHKRELLEVGNFQVQFTQLLISQPQPDGSDALLQWPAGNQARQKVLLEDWQIKHLSANSKGRILVGVDPLANNDGFNLLQPTAEQLLLFDPVAQTWLDITPEEDGVHYQSWLAKERDVVLLDRGAYDQSGSFIEHRDLWMWQEDHWRSLEVDGWFGGDALFNDDASLLLFQNRQGFQLRFTDSSESEIQYLGNFFSAESLSRDDRWLLFTQENERFPGLGIVSDFVLLQDGGNQRVVTPAGEEAISLLRSPVFHPDGSGWFFLQRGSEEVESERGEVWFYDRIKDAFRLLADDAWFREDTVSISPDGKMLSFLGLPSEEVLEDSGFDLYSVGEIVLLDLELERESTTGMLVKQAVWIP